MFHSDKEPHVIVLPAEVPKRREKLNPEPLPKSIAGWSMTKVVRSMAACGYGVDYAKITEAVKNQN